MVVVVTLFSAISGYFLVPLFLPMFSSLKKRNYKGELIPTGVGAGFVIFTVIITLATSNRVEDSLLFAFILLSFAFLGFIDDSLGTSEKKGFLGHLTAGKLSTGGLKALGGGAFSLFAGFFYGNSWYEAVLNGLIIALAANFLNLLDLRPGRCGKVFLACIGTLLLFRSLLLRPLLWLSAAVVGYLYWDLQGVVMMGDTGSNALGAALGLALIAVLSFSVKIPLVIFLLFVNLLSEKVSLCQIIDSNALLRFLDQLGRSQ